MSKTRIITGVVLVLISGISAYLIGVVSTEVMQAWLGSFSVVCGLSGLLIALSALE